MQIVQSAAKAASSILGRNSGVIRSVRPIYEAALMALHGGRGVPWLVNGVEYRVDPKERWRFAHHYEAEAAAYLAARMKPGMISFDVGANVGAYVLQLAYWSGPGGKVIAFEPNEGARDVMSRHLLWNGIAERVDVVPLAVSAAPGENVLYAEGANGMSRLAEANRGLCGAAVETVVPVTSIDVFCRERGVWPDVLLIDIEGFEIEALRGAREAIGRKRPVMVVEFHPNVWQSSNASRPAAEELLKSLGLRVVALSGQKDPLEDHGQVALEYV
jgi:FkbM family methyltransferase